MKCSKKDCENPAVVNVGVCAWSILEGKEGSSIQWFFDLCLCKRCRDSVRPEHILTEEGNAKMNAALAREGKKQIDFSTAQLMFRHVEDIPATAQAIGL